MEADYNLMSNDPFRIPMTLLPAYFTNLHGLSSFATLLGLHIFYYLLGKIYALNSVSVDYLVKKIMHIYVLV